VQIDGLKEVFHTNSSSTVQVLLQPSPLIVFPSSQASVPSFKPFPHFWQTVGDAPSQVYPLSSVQVPLHPSPSAVFPSSQISLPSFTPFPHFWQTVGDAPSQVYPLSSVQVPLHPSPSAKFPSSQATVIFVPSPQMSEADA
jgi:hypothetical protein